MNILNQPLALGLGFLVIGIGIGYITRQLIASRRRNSIELQIQKLHLDAKGKAQEIIETAKKESSSLLAEAKKEAKTKEAEALEGNRRIARREEQLDKKEETLEEGKLKLNSNVEKLQVFESRLKEKENEQNVILEKLSGMPKEEARDELLNRMEKEYEQNLVERMHKLEHRSNETLEQKAKNLLAAVIQRVAMPTISEATTTNVAIPSEDIKGKIIGKEGRNIRALERAAGVEIVVDETPGSIMISGFDPVRRHIAKAAMEELILDGRIHPARIEETVEKAKNKINKLMKDAAEQATYECGIFDVDPRLMQILGRLKFRTSYGQNVLKHSIEMAHVSGMLAAELGADVAIAKRGALLHDIGKAVDHEIQGTHVEIGRRILEKFGEERAVIQAMQSHHEEYEYETLESVVVQIADHVSGGRPGARRDSLENYIKKLGELEDIANREDGVEKSYAIQAGRELRVFVSPYKVNDLEAKKLARRIAENIEKEMKYPGEIKVMVIRENRVIEFAK